LLLFDKVFSEVVGRNLTHNFLGTEVGLKLFFICSLEIWGPFEGIVLTHYSCCQGSLWKEGTYTLQSLLVVPSKQGTYTLKLLFGSPLKA